MSELVIGVLALQGAFAKHIEMLQQLGITTKEVRYPKDLAECDGLIIPGGESTTIMHQMEYISFQESLREFAEKKPVFGTCAGLILISQKILSYPMQPFGLIDCTIERNAFGRQVDSFQAEIELFLENSRARPFSAIFIRAPRIRSHGPDAKVLAQYEDEPILIRQGHHLGSTFHPELTSDPAIHHYFIGIAKKVKTGKVHQGS